MGDSLSTALEKGLRTRVTDKKTKKGVTSCDATP
jgi:hypothetical protein